MLLAVYVGVRDEETSRECVVWPRSQMPVLLLQEWQTQPVKPDTTFQEFMREAQGAGEAIWIAAIAQVSQYHLTTAWCATFFPDMCNKITGTSSCLC